MVVHIRIYNVFSSVLFGVLRKAKRLKFQEKVLRFRFELVILWSLSKDEIQYPWLRISHF